MKRNKKSIIAAVAVIGALAAGGAAYTAATSLPATDVAGSASVTVTGGTVSTIHNVLNAGGDITSVELTFSPAVPNASTATVDGGFADETALDNCTNTDSGVGATWTCTVAHGSPTAGVEPIAGASSYKVVVAQ